MKEEKIHSTMIGWIKIEFAHPCGDQLLECFMAYVYRHLYLIINEWIYYINYVTYTLIAI